MEDSRAQLQIDVLTQRRGIYRDGYQVLLSERVPAPDCQRARCSVPTPAVTFNAVCLMPIDVGGIPVHGSRERGLNGHRCVP